MDRSGRRERLRFSLGDGSPEGEDEMSASALKSSYLAAKERCNELVVERAQRWIAAPEIYFAPDERDRELAGLIDEAKRKFLTIEAQYLSAQGQYIFIGCYAGEHKKCNRQIKRDSVTLVCGCECHQLQGGKNCKTEQLQQKRRR
jgi:hypothetical protein